MCEVGCSQSNGKFMTTLIMQSVNPDFQCLTQPVVSVIMPV